MNRRDFVTGTAIASTRALVLSACGTKNDTPAAGNTSNPNRANPAIDRAGSFEILTFSWNDGYGQRKVLAGQMRLAARRLLDGPRMKMRATADSGPVCCVVLARAQVLVSTEPGACFAHGVAMIEEIGETALDFEEFGPLAELLGADRDQVATDEGSLTRFGPTLG